MIIRRYSTLVIENVNAFFCASQRPHFATAYKIKLYQQD